MVIDEQGYAPRRFWEPFIRRVEQGLEHLKTNKFMVQAAKNEFLRQLGRRGHDPRYNIHANIKGVGEVSDLLLNKAIAEVIPEILLGQAA